MPKNVPPPSAPPADGTDALSPMYQQVLDRLRADIRAGHYPVGSTLPPELQLCDSYGVSRNTMREAIKRLVDAGMLSRNKRAGTRVESDAPQNRYVASLATLTDLLTDASRTYLDVHGTDLRLLGADEALVVGAAQGELWLCVETLRYSGESQPPVSHSLVYVHRDFAAIGSRLKGRIRWIHLLLQEHFGLELVRVDQEITAVALPAASAQKLGCRPGTPGLQVLRRYYLADGRLALSAVNRHAKDSIVLKTTWKLHE
jgi:GntR family transcriptional regulator